MSAPLIKAGELLAKFVGRAVKGPKTLSRFILGSIFSLADTVLRLLQAGAFTDIRRMKESLIRNMEAESDEKVAEANRKLADAAEAANRADLPKRRDALAMLERRKLEAEAAKTEAEARAIRLDAETRRLQAIGDATAKLMEAASKLRQDGGEVFFSQRNLEEILRLGLSPPGSDSETDELD